MSTNTGVRECASCLEDMSIKKLVDLTCQHKYCAPCFSQLVSTAMQNENFFPPKCCLQTIPTKLIQPHVPTDVKDLFKLKAKEYAVPAGERWYCPSPSCSKWMDRGKLSSSSPDSFKCPYCKSRFVEFVVQLHMMTTKTAHRTLAWMRRSRQPSARDGEDAIGVGRWWSLQSDAGILPANAKRSSGVCFCLSVYDFAV